MTDKVSLWEHIPEEPVDFACKKVIPIKATSRWPYIWRAAIVLKVQN